MDWILSIAEKMGADQIDLLIIVVTALSILGAILVIKWARDKFVNLQNAFEMTLAGIQIKTEAMFKEFKEQNQQALVAAKTQNEEHLKALQLVVDELREHKTWAGECNLKHKAICDKFDALEKRLDKAEAQILDLQKPKGARR